MSCEQDADSSFNTPSATLALKEVLDAVSANHIPLSTNSVFYPQPLLPSPELQPDSYLRRLGHAPGCLILSDT